jgi:hypothetical protein
MFGYIEMYNLPAIMAENDEDIERMRNVAVGTVKKSIPAIQSAWFLRNVRQVCEGGFC